MRYLPTNALYTLARVAFHLRRCLHSADTLKHATDPELPFDTWIKTTRLGDPTYVYVSLRRSQSDDRLSPLLFLLLLCREIPTGKSWASVCEREMSYDRNFYARGFEVQWYADYLAMQFPKHLSFTLNVYWSTRIGRICWKVRFWGTRALSAFGKLSYQINVFNCSFWSFRSSVYQYLFL